MLPCVTTFHKCHWCVQLHGVSLVPFGPWSPWLCSGRHVTRPHVFFTCWDSSRFLLLHGHPDWSSNGHGLAMLGSTLYWKLVFIGFKERAIFWTQTSFIQVSTEGLQSPTGYLKSWSFWWCEHLWIGPHFDDLRCKVCIHFLQNPTMATTSIAAGWNGYFTKINPDKSITEMCTPFNAYSIAKITKSGLLKTGTEMS